MRVKTYDGTSVEFRLTARAGFCAWQCAKRRCGRAGVVAGTWRDPPALMACVQPFGIPDNWIALKPPAVRTTSDRDREGLLVVLGSFISSPPLGADRSSATLR